MITATPAATSPQGWVSGARPMAYHGDMLSRPVCHFGGFFGGLGLPILRRCRTAISTRATPMAIFTARAASEGDVFGFGGLFPVTRRVTRDHDGEGEQPSEDEGGALACAALGQQGSG